MNERIEHRYLGAIRFLDRTTGAIVSSPMELYAAGVSLFRNRSSLHLISAAPRFDNYVNAFNDPPEPEDAPIRIPIRCADPAGRYLPRIFTLALPRNPDPAHRAEDDSLFRPVEVRLYPSPNGRIGANWSIIRASVSRQGGGVPIAGALLQVVRESDGALLGSGFSDERGEALVAVAGVPVTDFAAGDPGGEATGPVVVSEVQVRVEISHDPAAGWPADCEAVELQHAAFIKATKRLNLRTGRMETITVAITG
jgi:hypothetical protein